MIIVLIDWYIKPDKVEDFRRFWKQAAKIEDRAGLIGEFLSEPADIGYKRWITWNMNACIPADSCVHENLPYKRFVNVGLWMEEKSFEDAVAKYFNDSGSPKDFEYKRRCRALLTPKEWRVGCGKLPCCDSQGTE